MFDGMRLLHITTGLYDQVRVCTIWYDVCYDISTVLSFLIVRKSKKTRALSYSCRNYSAVVLGRQDRTRTCDIRRQCVRQLYDNVRVSCEFGTRNDTPALDDEYWREF